MTLHEQLNIIQAAIDGKTIERRHGDGKWHYDFPTDRLFNFSQYIYRVKPEPREWTIDEEVLSRADLKSHYLTRGTGPVRVREVLE